MLFKGVNLAVVNMGNTFDVDGLLIWDSLPYLVGGQALVNAIIGLMDTTNYESVLRGKEVGVLLGFDDFALQ